jgi:uncharacterized protein with GYD domain
MKACVLIKVIPGKHNEVVSAMGKLGGIKIAFSTLGRQDVVAHIEAADTRQLALLASQIQALPQVRGTETLVGVEV